jgi:hypothetical protein
MNPFLCLPAGDDQVDQHLAPGGCILRIGVIEALADREGVLEVVPRRRDRGGEWRRRIVSELRLSEPELLVGVADGVVSVDEDPVGKLVEPLRRHVDEVGIRAVRATGPSPRAIPPATGEQPPADQGASDSDDRQGKDCSDQRTARRSVGLTSVGQRSGRGITRFRGRERADRSLAHRDRQGLDGGDDSAGVVLRAEARLHLLGQDLAQSRVGDPDVVALPVTVCPVIEGDHEQEVGRSKAARLGRLGRESARIPSAECVRVPDPQLGPGRVLEVIEDRLDPGGVPGQRTDVVRDRPGEAMRRRAEDLGHDRQQAKECHDKRRRDHPERLAAESGEGAHGLLVAELVGLARTS